MKKILLLTLTMVLPFVASAQLYYDIYGNSYRILETVTKDNLRFQILADTNIKSTDEGVKIDTTFYYAVVNGPADRNISGDLIIPSVVEYKGREISVESIGDFNSCKQITSAFIPKSVKIIYSNAFNNCSLLENVSFESGDILLYENVFTGTPWYEKQENGPVYIGNVFYKYKGTIPEGTAFELKDGTISIAGAAFGDRIKDIGGLVSIKMPNTIKYAGLQCFMNCIDLKEVLLSENLVHIGSGSFFRCPLIDIKLPQTNLCYIGSIAFASCSNLSSVNIPSSVTEIGNRAFENCINLASVTLPSTLTSLREGIFSCCEKLASINLPKDLTEIGMNAFAYTGLTSVTLPNSIANIHGNAFGGCRLLSIVSLCPTAKLSYSAFSTATYNHAPLYVPEGKRWEAIYDGGWYGFINIRETVMDASMLSSEQAYTLINAQTFDYFVYDAVNGDVKQIGDFHNVDESIADNGWQIVKMGERNALYNIGAKKYAAPQANGRWVITDTPVALDLKSDEDGKITVNGLDSQWYLVLNEKLSVDKTVTAIEGVSADDAINAQYFSLDGRLLIQPRKGINIIRTKDGMTKKIIK